MMHGGGGPPPPHMMQPRGPPPPHQPGGGRHQRFASFQNFWHFREFTHPLCACRYAGTLNSQQLGGGGGGQPRGPGPRPSDIVPLPDEADRSERPRLNLKPRSCLFNRFDKCKNARSFTCCRHGEAEGGRRGGPHRRQPAAREDLRRGEARRHGRAQVAGLESCRLRCGFIFI